MHVFKYRERHTHTESRNFKHSFFIVAAMTILASQKEIETFQNRIRRCKEEMPRKTDDPSFDFEGTVGKSLYLPHLYISPQKLSSIARKLHDHYQVVLEGAGF
jgi:hypothetical protein